VASAALFLTGAGRYRLGGSVAAAAEVAEVEPALARVA
jgi:hypothetical protein